MKIIRSVFEIAGANQLFVGYLKSFTLDRLAKSAYHRIRTARNRRTMKLELDGIEAKFSVSSFQELRAVETTFGKNYKAEDKILGLLLKRLEKGDVAYDVGASIGIHSVFMARRVGNGGRVVAFEPEVNSCKRLQNNIHINGLNNVMVFNIGLGNRVCEGRLHNDRDVGLGAVRIVENDMGANGPQVSIVPGDQLVEEHSLPLPKAVKVDVEGYEYEVINGLRKTLANDECQMICCEIHPNLLPEGTSPATVLELLARLGFDEVETFERGGEIHAVCGRT